MLKKTWPCVGMLLVLTGSSAADESPNSAHRVHLELDPLPFALGGHGVQIGWRPAQLPELRIALANFALGIPDSVAQIDSANDGFGLDVRPTPALFVHYLRGPRSGFAIGGSLRYLRLRYSRGDTTADTEEVSLEAIAGYRWFPSSSGFYVHPWLGLSRALRTSGRAEIDGVTYSSPPVQPFATVNLGWELSL